jgi:3-hydroxyisobutyrate dehydrogenase-like beta-hydroxyacid dehydrogenase
VRFASTNGCRAAVTLADLAPCELVVTMLPDGHVVRSVMLEAGVPRWVARAIADLIAR